jgi:DNA-binding transcriptional ArsR family regulator
VIGVLAFVRQAPRTRARRFRGSAPSAPAGDIAARFDVTRQAISQHLGILLEAGLIHERREGTRRWYRARPEGLEEIRAYVETMWPDGLGRLKAAAEREHASRKHNAELN